MQVEAEPLLPIPVATEKRPDPRLALTIGVAGRIADPKDFGKPLMDLAVTISALHLLDWYGLLDWFELMHASTSALCCLLVQRCPNRHHLDCVSGQGHLRDTIHFCLGDEKRILLIEKLYCG